VLEAVEDRAAHPTRARPHTRDRAW
jgi:hypothetical protein